MERDGYDPASWDVWSAGVILLYMVGGDAIYGKLRGKTFNFFEFALRERSAHWVDGSARHRKWLQERALVGGDNLFYDTDMVWGRPLATDADGIPKVERDTDGVPLYPRLWRFMGGYDPDAAASRPSATNGCTAAAPPRQQMPFSPELKHLLNRMLDVDPRKRITVEQVCAHPWLQSHQARNPTANPTANPRDNQSWVESDEERNQFVAEMKKRMVSFVDPRIRVQAIAATGTFADAVAKIGRCLAPSQSLTNLVEETSPVMLNAGALGRAVVATTPAPGVASTTDGRPYRTFTVDVFTDVWKVHWESDGKRGCATLAEWHAFTAALQDCVEGRHQPSTGYSDGDELMRSNTQ